MSTALATVNQNSTAVATTKEELSREQVDLLKKTICYGATDAEFELFVGFCRRVQLDPFSKQVHFVPRRMKDPRTGNWIDRREPMIAIDGFRVIAERSGRYEGQTAPQWCGKDGKWVDVWLAEEAPAAARVGIYKAGFKEPIYQPASYLSYVQETKDGGPTATWKKMPDVMLSKCAEALALRKAFPNDLSGVYAPEEMSQAYHGNEDFIDVVAQQSEQPRLAAATTADVLKATREMGDGARAHEGMPNRAAPPSDTEVKLEFSVMSERLKKVEGYGGDDNKQKRIDWISAQLGYKTPPSKLFHAFAKADDATRSKVEAELAKLEAAAQDAMPDFTQVEQDGRQPGEEG